MLLTQSPLASSDVRLVRRVLAKLLILVAVIALLKLLVVFLEPQMVFFPFRGESTDPSAHGITYRRIDLATRDGERLAAWQLEPEHPVADVVYFHGNGGNLSVWLPVFIELCRFNLRVFAFDYRGYGLSTGRPTEQGLYLDAAAAVDHVRRERSDAGRPVIYWGRSLGGPVAAAAASMVEPDGLILESTFPEKTAVISGNAIFRALNIFSSYRFSTVDALRGFSRPVLVMHGNRDRIVPFEAGRTLFDRLSEPKRFVVIEGGDHNDAFAADNRGYWNPILEFISGLKRP